MTTKRTVRLACVTYGEHHHLRSRMRTHRAGDHGGERANNAFDGETAQLRYFDVGPPQRYGEERRIG